MSPSSYTREASFRKETYSLTADFKSAMAERVEDATLCNARLRTLEISQVFPIIDQAYQLKTKRQQQEIASERVWFISFSCELES